MHADIYFGLYQSLFSDRNGNQIFKQVPRSFFDLIIVDECHRSGFGTWREILDYFQDAIHLGLTATPKRTDNIDTYAYFGEPAYSYSLGQGIEDGFLATYKVHRVNTNLNKAGGVDIEDAVIAGADLFVPEGADDVKSFYSISEFERKISLPDWTTKICEHLAATLSSRNPMEKTIIFCVNMDHALEVRERMQNHFAHLGFSDYAVRIVAEEAYSGTLLDAFRDSHRRTPVVVTTVDLLSTGVDIPSVRNIVFIKPIGSVVVFKQIVGRGTRLDPATDKKWFRVIDYTNATRLFDEWDRPGGEPSELPPQPWEGIVQLEVIDSESTEKVPGVWAIAVAAPNEQVQFKPEGDVLIARELPETTIQVHVGAPGYNSRKVRLPATKMDEVQRSVVELRPVSEAAQHIVLTGLEVEIADEVILTVDAAGRQMTIDEYLAYARGALQERIASPIELRDRWVSAEDRGGLLASLEHEGIHLPLVADLRGVHDADTYDVIGSLAFEKDLIRRAERAQAFSNHNSSWLMSLPAETRAIAVELLDAYIDGGVEQLRRPVIKLERFKEFGGAVGVINKLGGSQSLDDLLAQLIDRLYPAREGAAA